MEGRVPRPEDPSKENGARNEKASRLSREKHNQSKKAKTSRERDSIHSKSLRLSSPLSSRPPPHLANHRRRNRAGSGRPCRSHSVPSPAEVKPCSSLCRFIFLGIFSWFFWVKSWVFREGGWGGALRISETLPERFECGKVDGSEGV